MVSLQTNLKNKIRLWKERLSCRSTVCRSGHRFWGRITDGIGSVELHGQRFCFPTCFEQELRARFSGLLLPQRQQHRPPHRVPLGLLMLSRGVLTDHQLRNALEAQRHSGSGRIGQWMQKLGYVDEHQITAALGAQWACPVLRSLPVSAAACAVPFSLLHAFEMVPVHYARATRVLYMAFARDIEYRALLAIEQIMECKAEPCLANPTAVQLLLAELEEQHRGSDLNFKHASSPEEMCRITSSYAATLGGEGVRLARCGDHIWVRIRARKDSVNRVFSQPHTSAFAFARGSSQMQLATQAG
jgi:hypothetical protein